MINIHTATQNDLLTLSLLHEQVEPSGWGEQAFRILFLQSGIHIWLAYYKETPVGFLVCRTVIDEAEILTIGVIPAYHRQHIAHKLISNAESILKDNNINKIHLEVRVNNIAALELYKNLSYKQTGIRKNYYKTMQGRIDGIMMMKMLP